MTETDRFEGRRLGRYRLVHRLARGGMAAVYLARIEASHGFQRTVAVKVIHPSLAADRHLLAMFLDEARVASLIHHTNVCSVLDFGVEEGTPYIVMEHLDGASLGELIREAPGGGGLEPTLAARIVAEAARGLHAAHETRDEGGRLLGVVHRDVSPPNIFVLREGSVRVLDFGVARMRGRLAETGVGELKGKVAYMAPEQIEGALADRRVDVWSLGVVLWEACTGRRLFKGRDFAASLDNVLHATVALPSAAKRGFPEALEAVVMSALERDPERRPQTAEALADGLERYLYGTGEPCGPAQVAALMRLRPGPDPDAPAGDPTERDAEPGPVVGFDETASIDEPPPAEAPPTPPAAAEPVEGEARPRRARRSLWPAALIVPFLAAASIAVPSLMCPSPGPGASGPDGGPRAGGAPEASDPPAPLARPGGAGPGGGAEAGPRPDGGGSDEAPEPDRSPPPSPPARPRPPAREPAPPGSLNLLAIPAASVSWNGRPLGRTPIVERAMPAGRHSLVLRPVEGGEPQTITVLIRPGETTRRTVRLR